MYYVDSEEGRFSCRCNAASVISGGVTTTCGPYKAFAIAHSPEAAASGLARRDLRMRAEQARLASQQFCPEELKACSKAGDSDAYECIDGQRELESCGGCLHGGFQFKPANATTGVDCSTLAGVHLGGVSCEDSACIAYSCEEGFELRSGICVPIA
ncbi:hypothetical protein IAT40_000085 [Kwoniella sp. CBS 6097]